MEAGGSLKKLNELGAEVGGERYGISTAVTECKVERFRWLDHQEEKEEEARYSPTPPKVTCPPDRHPSSGAPLFD
jgi:hypothetical protein